MRTTTIFLGVAAMALGACSTTIDGAADSGQTPTGADASPLPQGSDADPGPTEPETVTLSLSTGAPVENANVNCRYGENGPNADTSHFRVFAAEDIGGARITEAILPIEVAEAPGGTQSATLRFHRLTGDIQAGQFDPISELSFDVPDQTLGEVRVPLNVAIPDDTAVVVEVSMTDGERERNLRFGHNLEEQTGPTYYSYDACGQLQPVDLATLDNPFEEGETFAANSWLVSLTVERTP